MRVDSGIQIKIVGGAVSSTERHSYNGANHQASKKYESTAGAVLVDPHGHSADTLGPAPEQPLVVTATDPQLGVDAEAIASQRLASSIEAAMVSLQREAQTVCRACWTVCVRMCVCGVEGGVNVAGLDKVACCNVHVHVRACVQVDRPVPPLPPLPPPPPHLHMQVVGRFRHELIADLNESLRGERAKHSKAIQNTRSELEEVGPSWSLLVSLGLSWSCHPPLSRGVRAQSLAIAVLSHPRAHRCASNWLLP